MTTPPEPARNPVLWLLLGLVALGLAAAAFVIVVQLAREVIP